MALGVYFILFIVITVISLLGIVFLFLAKNESVKSKLFYFLAVWGMAISVLNATSMPSNFLVSQIICWCFGFISLAGLFLHIKASARNQYLVAYILVTISIVGSILKMFIL